MKSTKENQIDSCTICGERSDIIGDSKNIGWHYGVVTCQACKKFFLRSEKCNAFMSYKCCQTKDCLITLATRISCQFCRYQKCKMLGMDLKYAKLKLEVMQTEKQRTKCTVCANVSSGVHFGVLTCEGCKGFFSRSLRDKKFESFRCKSNHQCSISSSCRYCRFSRCLNVGMTPDGCRIGRPTNLTRFHRNDFVQSEKTQTNEKISPEANKPLSKRFKPNSVVSSFDLKENCIEPSRVFNPTLIGDNTDLLGFGLNHSDWYSRINKQLTNIEQIPYSFSYPNHMMFNHSCVFQPILDPTFNFHLNMNLHATLSKFN